MTPDRSHLSLPRGVQAAGPERALVHRRLEDGWLAACALAGFRRVEVPPLGYESTFTTGHHAAGDRIYRFTDRRGRPLALTPDSLSAALRAVLDSDATEQRVSYRCPVFRYEHRPRRFFHHLGLMEVRRHPVNHAAQVASTRRLALVAHAFVAPITAVSVTITDPGLWWALMAEHVPPADVAVRLDELRRLERPIWARTLHDGGASREFVQRVEGLASGKPDADDADHARRLHGCEEIAESLREDGATVHVDLGDLHASEFHDGPAFQIHVDGGRPLGDGGSYGGYASTFAGADTALFAAVVGLERLADIMIASGRAPSAPAADVAVLAMPDASSRRHADELALALRRSGVSVWDAERDGRGTRQRRLLEAAGICWTVTIGPRDIEAGTYAIRDPRGTVHHVSAHDVIGWLQSLLSGDADVP